MHRRTGQQLWGGVVLTTISIIIPALDEASRLPQTLKTLQSARNDGCEIIVVDGGSHDGTRECARRGADRVLGCHAGRAVQMNAGAAVARGDVLWFVHADTLPPADAAAQIRNALSRSDRGWGRFEVRLSGSHWLLRWVERLMNRRSRLTGIATGDQAVFVRRAWFTQVGGYPPIPLMEDVVLSRALKRLGRPACLAACVITSSRRWERNGVLRTIFLMWCLRLAYTLGASPAQLARVYGGG